MIYIWILEIWGYRTRVSESGSYIVQGTAHEDTKLAEAQLATALIKRLRSQASHGAVDEGARCSFLYGVYKAWQRICLCFASHVRVLCGLAMLAVYLPVSGVSFEFLRWPHCCHDCEAALVLLLLLFVLLSFGVPVLPHSSGF